MSDLGAGIRHPRNHQPARLSATDPEEQRVGHDQPGVGVGDVGEPEPGADVAHGEDPRVGGTQAVVHRHPALVESHAGLLEAEAVDVRRAADRDEQLVALERLGSTVALDCQHPHLPLPLGPDHPAAVQHVHAVATS